MQVYNPLAWQRETYFLKLPIMGVDFKVMDVDGEEIVSQILPISEDTLSIPGRNSIATHILYFNADLIPPLGSKIYKIEKVNTYEQVLKETRRTSNITFLNDSNELFINNDKEDMRVNLEMLYYEGHGGLNDKPEHRPSGAYIFR